MDTASELAGCTTRLTVFQHCEKSNDKSTNLLARTGGTTTGTQRRALGVEKDHVAERRGVTNTKGGKRRL
jgi:hypothetical protein